MPKVIEKLREELISEVRRELEEFGYSKLTIRTVAANCRVGVGTVYNYFSSKDELVASVVAEDWMKIVEIYKRGEHNGVRETLEGVWNMLKAFIKDHEKLFSDPEAGKKYSSVFTERHSLMRQQVASLIRGICPEGEEGEFLSLFLSEALLSWITSPVSFEKLYSVLRKLIGENNE